MGRTAVRGAGAAVRAEQGCNGARPSEGERGGCHGAHGVAQLEGAQVGGELECHAAAHVGGGCHGAQGGVRGAGTAVRAEQGCNGAGPSEGRG